MNKLKENHQLLLLLISQLLLCGVCAGAQQNLPTFPELKMDSIYFGQIAAASNTNNNNNPNLNDKTSDPRFDPRISQLLATSALQLAHDIGHSLLLESQEKTEVFSPLSIFGAINLLLLGANGKTFNEIMSFLKFNEDDYLQNNSWKIHEEFGLLLDDIIKDYPNPKHQRQSTLWKTLTKFDRASAPAFPGVSDSDSNNNSSPNETDHKITIANGIFVQKGFSIRPDYKSAVLDVYQSKMKNLDFANDGYQSSKFINEWVSAQTNGKIKEVIVDAVHPDTKVILVSALYFKARWERTFFDGATAQRSFYPNGVDNPPIQVDLMAHGGTFPFYDAKEYDCRILGFPYKKNLTTMYVILPNNSNREKLRELQALLTADKIENMISKMEWKTAVILFPKMHITNNINLKSIFKKLGIHSLFDKSESDLTLISNGYETSAASPPSSSSALFSSGSGFSSSALIGNNNEYSSVNNNNNGVLLSNRNPRLTTKMPRYPGAIDSSEDDDVPLIFSRHGEDDDGGQQQQRRRRRRNVVSYKVPSSSIRRSDETLRLKDFIISKRITKGTLGKKNIRGRRSTDLDGGVSTSLKNLDRLRTELQTGNYINPGLFADEIIHKVDLSMNERGTEGGAATITLLYRTGTDVVFRVDTPFMFLIRHDDTKLPLFYGTVFEPTPEE